MQSTSVKAYHEEIESGKITKKQAEVLEYVRMAGPITGRQVSKVISGGHKRLAELKALGRVIESGTTKDPITGKIVYQWVTTQQAPLLDLTVKRQSRRELLNRIEAMGKLLQAYAYKLSEAYDKGFTVGRIKTLDSFMNS